MADPARCARWAALAWCAVILCSVPMARALQGLVVGTVGRDAYLVVVFLALALALGLSIRHSWRVVGPELGRRLPWLVVPGLVAAGWTWQLRHAPEEALHFVEYGVLGLLLFRALRFSIPDRALFPAVILLGALFGVLDELVQWLVPGRFWDLRDVSVDTMAVVLGLVALGGALRPPELSRRSSPRSVRRLCGLAAGLVLVSGLSLSNTPPRIQALARLVPALGYLEDYGSVMTEYGYLHPVPGVGRLYSRLDWPELRVQDRQRSVEVARILDGYPTSPDYRAFLWDYPPFGDSFVHELRVHLFRRDRYLDQLGEPGLPLAERQRLARTAWAEEHLLQACCAATIAASSYVLPADVWEPHEELLEGQGEYTSKVSRHLIVRFRQRQAWAVVGLLLAMLAGVAFAAGRRGSATGERAGPPDR